MNWTARQLAAIVLLSLTILPGPSLAEQKTTVLSARDFGVIADGKNDDGPAIQQALDAAAEVDGPVRILFPSNATIRVQTAKDGYVLSLQDRHDLTIDGRGSTFLLDPPLGFANVQDASNIHLRRLQIDYDLLPFVDGQVVSVDAKAKSVVVRVPDPKQAARALGGPTDHDDEQKFFAMLWNPGPFDLISKHCWVSRIEATDDPNQVTLTPTAEFDGYDLIQPGVTQISLPVPGIAHRVGAGPCLRIRDCRDIALSDIELWSAPWFGIHIMGCEGTVMVTRVNIRPKPGSGRLMSTWRDGFHVKGNRGKLRFSQCIVTRTCDDAFNISTHASRLASRTSDTQIVVRQHYPLNHVPWRVGDTIVAADLVTRKIIGQAKVTHINERPLHRSRFGSRAAPLTELTLDQPLPGLNKQSMLWSAEAANPDTILNRCTIGMSCRFQSPVSVRHCDVTALLWFYAASIEGPFPSGSAIHHSTIRQGRGSNQYCVIVSGEPRPDAGPDADAAPRAIKNFTLTHSTILGGIKIQGVQDLTLNDNTFPLPDAPRHIQSHP